MKTLLLLIPLALLGCEDDKSVEKRTNAAYALEVRTIVHDGHKIIAANTGYKDGGVSLIHHPDCECLSPKR